MVRGLHLWGGRRGELLELYGDRYRLVVFCAHTIHTRYCIMGGIAKEAIRLSLFLPHTHTIDDLHRRMSRSRNYISKSNSKYVIQSRSGITQEIVVDEWHFELESNHQIR